MKNLLNMKKIIFLLLILFLLMPLPHLHAQTQTTNEDIFEFPLWAKDLRRFDIITFGAFPFSMFFVTFATDMVRWNDANGLDFSEEGRRYAPWPMKSKGAELMTNDEYYRTVMIAIGVSAAIALIDLAVVNIMRHRERRRLDARASGTYTIEKKPVNEEKETGPEEEKNDN